MVNNLFHPSLCTKKREYSQDLNLNNPLYWIVRHPPSAHMDRDGWLKSMTQFTTVYGTSTINNKIIFFGGHGSHFDDHALSYIQEKYIQPFVLNSGYSGNDHPNGNEPNVKLKSHYNDGNVSWMLKYGMAQFLYLHMNSLLMEEWDAFRISARSIIREIFLKTKLPPV